jgi:hypothetical protein
MSDFVFVSRIINYDDFVVHPLIDPKITLLQVNLDHVRWVQDCKKGEFDYCILYMAPSGQLEVLGHITVVGNVYEMQAARKKISSPS